MKRFARVPLLRLQEMRLEVFIALLSLAFFLLHALVLPTDTPLRKDAYAYFLKAQDTLSGDFTPVVTRPIGWSLLEAPLLASLRSASLRRKMNAARVLSAAINALHIPVLWLLLRQLGRARRSTLVLLALFLGISVPFVGSGVSALSEPAFSVLLLAFLAALLRSTTTPRALLLSGGLAGALSTIRLQGMALPLLLLAACALPTYRSARRFLPGALLLFLLPVAAQELHRSGTIGRLLDYGPNSRLFATGYEELWVGPRQTFQEFLRAHPPPVLLGQLGRAAAANSRDGIATILPFPLFLLAAGSLGWLTRPKGAVFLFFIALWWVSLLPVYRIHADARYWIPLLPLGALIAVEGLRQVAASTRFPRGASALLVTVTLSLAVPRASEVAARHRAHRSLTADPGLTWIADHARGVIATVQVGDLFMQRLQDVRIGGRDEFTLCAPETNLGILRPGLQETVPEFLADLRARGATHLLVAPGDETRRPLLPVILQAPPPSLVPIPIPEPRTRLSFFALRDMRPPRDPCTPYQQ